MKLLALPAFTDNYIWMLHDDGDAWVVDPGDAGPVLQALDHQRLRLRGILVTHHHADHIGGVAALRPVLAGDVWGPAGERLPGPPGPVRHLHAGDEVVVLGRRFGVLEVPGHTAGHIAYRQLDGDGALDEPLLFCGDTLFSAGCGRIFEGTPAQLRASLEQLAGLPPATRVCCTHEYTLGNLRFAAAVEPDNPARRDHQARCEAQRARGEPTLPSRLQTERAINPFLRCGEAAVIDAARRQGAAADDPLSVFTALREWKNRF